MRPLFALILFAGLTACGQTGPLQMPPPREAPPPPAAQPQVAPGQPETTADD